MHRNPVRGHAIRWTFSDGPMAKKTFEHMFGRDGSVKWREIENESKDGWSHEIPYHLANIGADVYAVSYLAPSGYTLTAVLDYRTGQLVAFASNEKSLSLQHGTFQPAEGWMPRRKRERSETRAHRSH